MSEVIVRMAPSPTGNLHIGTLRTALFNYLFAKQHNGKIILRYEDTDKNRSKDEYVENIEKGLNWLGIEADETFFHSQRRDIHAKYLKKMIDNGSAYISVEEANDGSGEKEIIRFKNPNKTVVFNDLIRGNISFDTTELGDFVIAKSIDEPLYHIAVVVDDHEMGVTHIIRGEDHISNTPRHILIQEAIGAETPVYVHLPLILAPDKSKMSKRHGAVSVDEYREMGFLKEALINYVAFLGWNPGDDREIFSLEDLIKVFDIHKIQKGGAVFNIEKLRWFNKEYLKGIPKEEFIKAARKYIDQNLIDDNLLNELYTLLIERVDVYSDIKTLIEEGEFDYLYKEPKINKEKIIWKKSDSEKTIKHLSFLIEKIENIDNKFSKEELKDLIWEYSEEKGKGDVLWPLRFALTGKEKSPDPFTVASLLGREKALNRIKKAISILEG